MWDNWRTDGGVSHFDLNAQLGGLVREIVDTCVMGLNEFGSEYAPMAVNGIDADPLFKNPAIDDFRLQCGSPAIDAAVNALSNISLAEDMHDLFQDGDVQDDDLNPDLQGNGRILNVCDMGAYERVVDACITDVNGDDAVNVNDLLAVIVGWGACAAPPAACPEDVNGPCPSDANGVVDVNDLLAVIVTYGTDCDGPPMLPHEVPESYYDCVELCSGLTGAELQECMEKCFAVLCSQGQTEFCE